MKKILIVCLSLAIVTMFFSGCSYRVGDFTVISTKNVDIGGKYKKIDQRFEGIDSRPIILSIPLGRPDLKQAVDNCIEAGKGELISNAVVDFSIWTIILYGEQKYVVKGDVWQKASTSDLDNPKVELYTLQASAEGYQLVSSTDPSKSVNVEYLATR